MLTMLPTMVTPMLTRPIFILPAQGRGLGADVAGGFCEMCGVSKRSLGGLAVLVGGGFVEGGGVQEGADLMVDPVVLALDAVRGRFVLVRLVDEAGGLASKRGGGGLAFGDGGDGGAEPAGVVGGACGVEGGVGGVELALGDGDLLVRVFEGLLRGSELGGRGGGAALVVGEESAVVGEALAGAARLVGGFVEAVALLDEAGLGVFEVGFGRGCDCDRGGDGGEEGEGDGQHSRHCDRDASRLGAPRLGGVGTRGEVKTRRQRALSASLGGRSGRIRGDRADLGLDRALGCRRRDGVDAALAALLGHCGGHGCGFQGVAVDWLADDGAGVVAGAA